MAAFSDSSVDPPMTEDEIVSSLYELVASEGNEKCADCNGHSPTWASINNSVFICTSCAGVHRSLGVDISFVKSIKLDKWKPENLMAMKKSVSTAFINETLLEYSVPADHKKPHPDSCREDRMAYIRAKYVDRLFFPGSDKAQCPPVTMDRTEANSSAKGIGEIEFVGVFMIKLVSCKNLVNADVVGVSDPYVVMKLGTQTIKSRRILNNLNPVFNEMMMLAWNGLDFLSMTVFDEDAFSEDGVSNVPFFMCNTI
jgi:stromal membrane-associated protein